MSDSYCQFQNFLSNNSVQNGSIWNIWCKNYCMQGNCHTHVLHGIYGRGMGFASQNVQKRLDIWADYPRMYSNVEYWEIVN